VVARVTSGILRLSYILKLRVNPINIFYIWPEYIENGETKIVGFPGKIQTQGPYVVRFSHSELWELSMFTFWNRTFNMGEIKGQNRAPGVFN